MTSEEEKRTAPGELLLRTFGPMSDSLGLELAKVPAFVAHNLIRLAELFSRKDSRGDVRELSPRLLRQVLDEAMYADDEIVAEYLSGVLASSGDGLKNDRGVTVTALIRRLSAVQLKVHYVFYSELLRHRVGTPIDLRWSIERARLHVEFGMEEFLQTLGLEHLDEQRRRDVVGHAIWGLSREELIDEDTWEFVVRRGEQTPLGAHAHTDRDPMLSFHPTPLGVELFLWGCGSAVVDPWFYLDEGLELIISEEFPPLCSTQVSDMTGISADAIALEAARDREDWDQILASAPSANAAAGVPEFYAAIALLFSGDLGKAHASMSRCWEVMAPTDKTQGLKTLDSLRATHPMERRRLWTLSEILANGVARTESADPP